MLHRSTCRLLVEACMLLWLLHAHSRAVHIAMKPQEQYAACILDLERMAHAFISLYVTNDDACSRSLEH